MRIYLETLGCSKNQVDSERLLYILKNSGYEITFSPEEADIIIVNSCAFIKSAKEESIETILELAKFKKIGKCKKLIVAGCLSQYYHNILLEEMPEIDAVFGIGNLRNIITLIENNEKKRIDEFSDNEIKERIFLSPPGSAYLKISDGCSNHCSYCIIPKIRGSHRSRKMEDILKEVEILVNKDIKEINIIAQDTTNYGIDLYQKKSLINLLKEIDKIVNKGSWIRVLYMHPDHLDLKDIEELAKLENFIPYFDLPFQSGSDTILESMNRKKKSDEYLLLLAQIRETFKNPVIRSTFITGFPGETEKEFSETLSFLEKAQIDWVGGFTYSKEEGTVAYSMNDQIPGKIKKQRLKKLLALSEKICRKRLKRFLSLKEKFLIEEKIQGENLYFARFWAQAPEVDTISVIKGEDLKEGDFILANIEKINDRDFFCKALK